MSGLRAARLVAPLLSVIALHGVIVCDKLYLAPSALSLGFVVAFVSTLSGAPRSRRVLIVLGLVIVTLWGVQALAIYVDVSLAMAVKLPPILIHFYLAWMFGRTLRPGHEPLVRRFSRLSRGTAIPELESYVRLVTVLWAVTMTAMALVALIAAVTASLQTWTWTVNVGLPVGTVALFLGEHAYRAVRFRHLGMNSPLKTLRTLVEARTWTAP